MPDSGALPVAYFRSVYDIKADKYTYEAPFDYICVYDFECQCDKNSSLPFNEIIEFPVVVVDVKNQKIAHEFHTYVKPVIVPKLTDFCTELTGIKQDEVDKGILIQDAMKQLHKFLDDNGIFKTEFVFASCGDFDGNQMKRESAQKQFEVPSYLKRWINLKKVFSTGEADPAFSSAKTITKAKAVIGGMTEMLDKMGLEPEGRHHSGKDDARNLARVVIEMLRRKFVFGQGMVHVSNY